MRDEHVTVPVTHEEDEGVGESVQPTLAELLTDLNRLRAAKVSGDFSADEIAQLDRDEHDLKDRIRLLKARAGVLGVMTLAELHEALARLRAGDQSTFTVDDRLEYNQAERNLLQRIRAKEFEAASAVNWPSAQITIDEPLKVVGYEPRSAVRAALQQASVAELREALHSAERRAPVGVSNAAAAKTASDSPVDVLDVARAAGDVLAAQRRKAALVDELTLISEQAWTTYSTLREDGRRASKREIQGDLATVASLISDLANAVKEII